MRGIIPLSSGVVGLLIGLGLGLTLAPHTVVVREAPLLSMARYVASSEAQAVGLSEAEWGALWVRWRLRHWWPLAAAPLVASRDELAHALTGTV